MSCRPTNSVKALKASSALPIAYNNYSCTIITVLIMFPPILQTTITAQTSSDGGNGITKKHTNKQQNGQKQCPMMSNV